MSGSTVRLRSLRRLEEMEIKGERAKLEDERESLTALLASPARQRTRMKRDLAVLKERYGPDTALGKRRTTIEEAGPAREYAREAMIDKEPITVVLSQRGWIRALKGHADLASAETMKFKEGDGPAFAFHAQTTDKILIAAENGRFYTLAGDKLPGGRGFGEPIGLMIDLDGQVGVAACFAAGAGKLLLASSDGRGFLAKVEDAIAETRKGKQLVNLRPGAKLKIVRRVPDEADYVAVVGDNRKMVLFPLSELPEMSRGQGVTLQRYRDGGLSDAIALSFADGLSWSMGGGSGRTRSEADLSPWRSARGAAGRMAPIGFPRDNRFG
jgi:topoisomerase-4 subunit A